MRAALEAVERIRVNTSDQRLTGGIEETITNEISLLQAAIMDVEQRMDFYSSENTTLKQNLDEKIRVLSEVTLENEDLIDRLHVYENEFQSINSNMSSSMPLQQQTQRIRQLESDLSKALSGKESMLNSTTYAAIDKTTDEQGQVIESLIDDNEKHLETIQQKDQIIEQLQDELRKLSEVEKGSSEPSESIEKYIEIIQNKNREIEKLTEKLEKTSRTEEIPKESITKYVTIIQQKNKTIDELREQIDQSRNDSNDKRVINDLINTLSKKANDSSGDSNSQIGEELQKIKGILSSSHQDLVNKIITLEQGVDNLREENRSLRKQIKKENQNTAKESEMDEKFHKVMEENATLRESLNKPYPGLVQNILLQTDEVKRLHEENELLRLGLSENKRELVDSNLRKRQRIKDLQTKLEELEDKDRSGSGTTRKPRRPSLSMRDNGGETVMKVDTQQETSVKEKELVAELNNQNAMLHKMEDERNKMVEKSRRQLKEIRELKEDNLRLNKVDNSNKALEYEVKSLKDALKGFGGRTDGRTFNTLKDQQIQELQGEILLLKEKAEEEHSALNMDDNKAKDDLHRMAIIADRERRRTEESKDEIDKLSRELERSEMNNCQLEDQLCEARDELDNANKEVKRAFSEANKLRNLLDEKVESEEKDSDEVRNLTEDLTMLQEDSVILQNKLEQARQKNILLDRENKALKTKLQESANDNIDAAQDFEDETSKARGQLIELNNELDHYKLENKELQDINEALVDEVQKMKSKKNETHFKNWLDQDVEQRLALLSPDTHRSDYGLDERERQMKKDQQRLIRKLQIENQIVKAKLLSLEEENIASMKIISDMERGHGHLTGTLRSHLILQQQSTAKLLENALQQYTTDYENLKKKYTTLEEKYGRRKSDDDSKRRDDIWELFTNAGATISNINTILNEGLVKVDDDLEKEDDYNDDFESRDYKSRLWILRRRLSDVENRHRELQLKAEELNLRLDAKQTEFEVTQDELEDATRDLETRENHVQKLKTELDHVSREKSRLARLMNTLKRNEDRKVGDVIAENETLADEMNPKMQPSSDNGLSGNPDLSSLIAKLKERDAALNIMRKMRDETEKDNDELKRRVNYLERKLKEMTDQRDKLQKEAEYRAGYMSFARDDYGTIHMLRDDLKRIAKENADLKHDVVLKQRQMYDMSKDLHKLRIKLELDSSPSSKTGAGGNHQQPRREQVIERLINDLATNKAEKFILETKLKDMERRLGGEQRSASAISVDAVDGKVPAADNTTQLFKQKLVEKEREIEKLKRGPLSRSPSPTKSPMPPKDDTMSDVISAFDSSRSEKNRAQLELKRRLEEVIEENQILSQAIREKGLRASADYMRKLKNADKKISQQKTEINTLNSDNEKKRKRIRELLTAIEEIKSGGNASSTKSQKKFKELCEQTKEDEMASVLEKLKKSKNEVNEWKNKADSYQQELEHFQQQQKQQQKESSIMDQEPPLFDEDIGLLTPELTSMSLPPVPNKEEEQLYEPMGSDQEHIYEKPIDSGGDAPEEAISRKAESTTAKKSASRIPSPVKRAATKTAKSADKKKTGKQVSDLSSTTRQELDIYRTNLDMNEYDTLDILGADKLNYVIDFQISRRCTTELRTMKNDIYELEFENETLQSNYVNLADSVNEFNDDLRTKLDKTGDVASEKESDLFEENNRLKSELKMTCKDVKELNEQIEKNIREVTMMDETIQKCETEISEAKQREQDWINKISELEAANENLHNKVEQAHIENSSLRETITQKGVEKKSKGGAKTKGMTTEIIRLKEELKVKADDCEHLKENLRKKTEEYAKLQKKYNGANIVEKNRKLKRIKEELLEKTKELQEINGQLEERIEEVNTLKSQLKLKEDEQQQSSKDDLEAIAALRQELSQNAAEILKRNEIIQELRTHIDKIKEQESERQKQEQLDYEDEKLNFAKEISELKEKIKNKDSESEVYLDETVRAMEDAKERLVQEINTKKRLEEDVRSLNEKLEYTKQRNEIMAKEMKENKQHYEIELLDIVRALEESETQVQMLEEKMNEEKPQVIDNQILNNEKRIEQLENDVKESITKLEQSKNDKEKTVGTLARLSDEYAAYRKAAEEEVIQMTKEINLLKKKISWLEAEKKKVPPPKMPAIQEETERDESNVISIAVPAVEEEIVTAETVELSMAEPCDAKFPGDMMSQQEQAELELEVEILQGCNEELEQEVENLKKQKILLEDAKNVLEKEHDTTKEDLKKTLNYLDELTEKNVSLVSELQAKEQSLDSWENKANEMAKKNISLINEIQAKEQSLDAWESKANDITERNASLLTEIQAKEKSLVAWERKANEMEQELDSRDGGGAEEMEHQVQKLELELRSRELAIRELEVVVDQLEDENLRKDDAFEKLRANNENNIQELEKVTQDLEDEFNARESIATSREQLQNEIDKKNSELSNLHEKIKELEVYKETNQSSEKLHSEIERLEKELDSWNEKSTQQSLEIKRLSEQLKISRKEDEYQNDHSEALRQDIESKSFKIQTLQHELEIRDDQYRKVLASLNKRREESKQFLIMQQKLRDEIDSKEDFIRKLNFKLKSNDLDITASSLNVSRDDDLDQSDGRGSDISQLDDRLNDESTNENTVIVISHEDGGGEGDSIFELSKQLTNVRSRNKILSKELETCRAEYMVLHEEKHQMDLTNQTLTNDNQVYQNRVTELRDMIQNSPDLPSDDGPDSIEVRTKLFASYKELRERSIETASLRMCSDVKDDQITSLQDMILNLQDEIRGLRETTKDNLSNAEGGVNFENLKKEQHQEQPDNIKTLLKELQTRGENEQLLQKEVNEMRNRLMQKCKQNDQLQSELTKITTRFRDIEQKLGQDDLELRNRFLRVFENDDSEISEVTPLNSLKMYSALELGGNAEDDSDNDEEFSLTENLKKDTENEGSAHIRDLQLKTEEENLFYKEQVKSLQDEIDRINQSHSQKTDENRDLQRLLSDLQIQLRELETTKKDGE